MQPEIKEAVEKNMELMLRQTKTYMPFLRIAFPQTKDLPQMCYNLMMGNALMTFLSQYALRMQTPSEKDFAEFGALVEQYKDRIKESV